MSNYFWHSFSIGTELQECKLLKSQDLITCFSLGYFDLGVCLFNKFSTIEFSKLNERNLVWRARIIFYDSIFIFFDHDFMTQVQNS